MITMRTPFLENQISKLPKPTKQQTDALKADFKAGIRCPICKGWHHKDVVHLDYVGHAALTDRLLDVDPDWNWEPVSWTQDGQPALDRDGGMWIKLTVLGVTRLGYGDAQGKTGGDAMKERIGDALRNAGMRFGAALDLWHKGDLHVTDDAEKPVAEPNAKPVSKSHTDVNEIFETAIQAIKTAKDMALLESHFKAAVGMCSNEQEKQRVIGVKDLRKAELSA